MSIKKIIKNIKHLPMPIPSKDKGIIRELKKIFEHNKRTFVFNRFKYFLNIKKNLFFLIDKIFITYPEYF